MNALSRIALISIHPDHAVRIYAGSKRAELRKSFNDQIRIVFLYETAPSSAVTGCFLVRNAFRRSSSSSVSLASEFGVDYERATNYFNGRKYGWVIEVAASVRFARPVSIRKLQETNHYFSAPQAFSYLSKYEGITQILFKEMYKSSKGAVRLRRLGSGGRHEFGRLVLSDVGAMYDDIDADFVEQITKPKIGSDSAFSTKRKVPLEIVMGKEVIGFTVLTEKSHNAWKSGPTILLPEFRGCGLGRLVRSKLEQYCIRQGGRSLYCSCASSQPGVVGYLLNSGMQFQARLHSHLSGERDEIVFAKNLVGTFDRAKLVDRDSIIRGGALKHRKVERIEFSHRKMKQIIDAIVEWMPYWYFPPPKSFSESIQLSLETFEKGIERHSSKPRWMYVCFDGAGKPRVIALGTKKRSNMIKLNILGSTKDARAYDETVRHALNFCKDSRRVYLTVPTSADFLATVLSEMAFKVEGILEDPFGTGENHLCFGKVG